MLEGDLKKLRTETKSFKKAFEIEYNKQSWESKLVQRQKEELLKEIGTDRGASRGGDLQGRVCTNFLQNANVFF